MAAEAWVDDFLAWDAAAQRAALEALLRRWDGRAQLRVLMHELDKAGIAGGGLPVKPRAPSVVPQVDFIDLLPRVLCTYVLRFMEMHSLATCASVSKRWRHRTTTQSVDDLWQAEFLRLHSDSTFLNNFRLWRNYSWREICLMQGRSREGWMHSSVSKQVFQGHRDRVRHVRIRRDIIVSSSWDRSLRVIRNDDSFTKSKQVASHGGSVYGMSFNGEIAVACSEDSTIKIWNVIKETCEAELIAHSSAVYRVAMMTSEILISCCRDFIGVWHWPSKTLLHRLTGHMHDVHRIQAGEDIFVTGSYDATVRVWGYPSCEALWASPPCHKMGVSCLHFEGSILASGSAKGEIFIWDLVSGARRHSFDPNYHNESTISCILVIKNRVFSTSTFSLRQNDGIVCVWDSDAGVLLARMVEPFHINALKKDFGLVYCACSDGVLRIRSQARDDFSVVRELEHGTKPLYDVDVQGPRAVTCGLDKAVVLWTVNLHEVSPPEDETESLADGEGVGSMGFGDELNAYEQLEDGDDSHAEP